MGHFFKMKSLVPLFLTILFVCVYNERRGQSSVNVSAGSSLNNEMFAIETANVYHKALQKCHSRGGLPAMIRNKKENEIAFEMTKHLTVAPFIGIEANLDEFGEITNWTYSDESRLSYENWNFENSKAVNAPRICTALSLTTGQWEAVHCYVPRPFLCSLQQKESRDYEKDTAYFAKKPDDEVVEDCGDAEKRQIVEIEKKMKEIRQKLDDSQAVWLGINFLNSPAPEGVEHLDHHVVWLSDEGQLLPQIIRVLAVIKPKNLGQGSSVPSDQAFRLFYQFASRDCDSNDLGHVIAQAYGGPGITENIVLQDSEFHQNQWKGREGEILEWLKSPNAVKEDRYVKVVIAFTYPDEPAEFTQRPDMFYYDFEFYSKKNLVKRRLGAYENENQWGVAFADCKVGTTIFHYPRLITQKFYKRRSCTAATQPAEGYGQGLWPTVPKLEKANKNVLNE